MKKLLLLFIPIFSFSDTIDVDKVVKNIANIKKSIHISATLDYNVYDPFATAKPIIIQKKKDIIKKLPVSRSVTIQTILNKKVLINNRWFSVGDRVDGGLIKSIHKDYIIIIKNKKWIKVATKRKKKLIYIKGGSK